MFRWLKQKAIGAAQNQCRLNIKLTTKSLILVADQADAAIQSAGDSNESQKSEVLSRQQRLFQELLLAHSNGIQVDELKSMLDSLVSDNASTQGASIAVQHTFDSFASEL